MDVDRVFSLLRLLTPPFAWLIGIFDWTPIAFRRNRLPNQRLDIHHVRLITGKLDYVDEVRQLPAIHRMWGCAERVYFLLDIA